MAYEFKLPDLGEGLTEGEVARWLVAEGQEIAAKHYFRPQSKEVLVKYAKQFPDVKLFTLAEVAGDWQKTQKTHFNEGGVFDQIFKR